ncbi:lipopolysaccharide export system permease protein [Methylobacillus rhizosphaerae]|uniref:Lipopolysaccharide export system permease protein n=1 Tax=Methylobacillus rhizosphaerae TaxID=551994 RepID=A0A238Z546_9PROT|nr:LPS export ABC transporter permease LptG [Methylobacillus rhizosphaerae]SNR78575.1 lipopolysaccharide export system permease protein [Methylobacillus rhizosphaerae]
MKLLNRYLAQEIISSIMLIMLALLAMFSFFDLIQELENLGKGNYGISKVLLYVLLSAPGHVYEVVPVAVLVGTMYALGQFSRYSELIILRVSGVSIRKIAFSLLRVGLLFAIVTFLVGELVAPLSEKSAQRIRVQATDSVVAQDFRSGLWVKDGNSFVNVQTVMPDASLMNINIYEFDNEFRLRTISNAKDGSFDGKNWNLHQVTQTHFEEQKIRTSIFQEATWQSLIRPELLNVLLVVPEKMSAWNLYFYINHLSSNKQKTSRHQIALWSKMIYPLACLVMVILALPFGFLQQRSGSASTKIFAGIMLGIVYQVLNRVFVHLGLLNDWSPLFSAVVPTLLFMAAGIFMLHWVERR